MKRYQLQNYILNKLEYKKTENLQSGDRIEFAFDVNVARNTEQTSLYKADLHLSIDGRLQGLISLSGIFEDQEPDKEVQLKELYVMSANILIPYARSLISSISAFDGSKPIMLPSVDWEEAWKDDF